MRKIKILIADDDEMLRDIVEMVLENEVSAEFYKAENGKVAIDLLKEHDIDLIISDYNMPIKTGGDVFKFNVENKNLPFIILSGGQLNEYKSLSNLYSANSLNKFVTKPYEGETLANIAKEIITKLSSKPSSNPTEVQQNFNDDFVRINLEFYIKYSTSISDVYINIHSNKLTKIIDDSPESSIDDGHTILKKYLDKGIGHIYLKKETFKNILDTMHEKMLEYKAPEEKIEIAGMVFNLSVSCLTSLGMSDYQIELINNVLEETIVDFEQNKNLLDKFKSFNSPGNYVLGHSLFCIYIMGMIVKETNLPFNTTMKKLGMAAFMHDLTMAEDKYAQL